MTVTVETTEKGFKVIPVTHQQCIGWGGAGICDSCNEVPLQGMYVAVLNWYMCQTCYEKWHRGAKNYPEDHSVEHRNVIRMVQRLSDQPYV